MVALIGKKRFFSELSPAEIKKNTSEIVHTSVGPEGIVRLLMGLDNDKGICIDSCIEGNPIIPGEHYENAYGGPYPVEGSPGNVSWHFLRHGPEASITQFKSVGDLEKVIAKLRDSHDELIPNHIPHGLSNVFYFFIVQCAQAYNRAFAREVRLSGYTFKPVLGNDKRIRKVSLIELLESAWLDAYTLQQERVNIRFGTSYAHTKSVSSQGAIVDVSYVPSRRVGESPYEFDLKNVPIIYNDKRHSIVLSLDTSIDNHPELRNLRRAFGRGEGKKDPNMKYFVAQEIAAYNNFMRLFGALSADEIRAINRGNVNYQFARIVPLEMSPFRIPTQETVDFYLKMLNRVVVAYHDDHGKVQYRKLVKAEQEILMSEFVRLHEYGIWDTFFLKPGEKMQELQWVNRPTREL